MTKHDDCFRRFEQMAKSAKHRRFNCAVLP